MNRFALLASFLLAGALLGGCPETARCPEGQVRAGGECVDRGTVDGGGFDGAVDGQVDGGADAGPCGECGEGTPYCVIAPDGGAACRECDPGIGNDSCSRFTDRPFCDPDTQLCVECLGNEQCTDPGASRCNDANECVPCGSATDCEHVMDEGANLRYCESVEGAARCVQCTLDTEGDDCGSFVCDPQTLRCTMTVRERAGTCQPCISDSHCAAADDSCVPLSFDGTARGHYCLRNFSAGCVRPFNVQLTGRMTRSGVSGLSFCGIDESLTTCEAVIAALEGDSCPSGTAAECATEGAICGTVTGLANVCSYPCDNSNQCPSGMTCPLVASAYCGGPS